MLVARKKAISVNTGAVQVEVMETALKSAVVVTVGESFCG